MISWPTPFSTSYLAPELFPHLSSIAQEERSGKGAYTLIPIPTPRCLDAARGSEGIMCLGWGGGCRGLLSGPVSPPHHSAGTPPPCLAAPRGGGHTAGERRRRQCHLPPGGALPPAACVVGEGGLKLYHIIIAPRHLIRFQSPAMIRSRIKAEKYPRIRGFWIYKINQK